MGNTRVKWVKRGACLYLGVLLLKFFLDQVFPTPQVPTSPQRKVYQTLEYQTSAKRQLDPKKQGNAPTLLLYPSLRSEPKQPWEEQQGAIMVFLPPLSSVQERVHQLKSFIDEQDVHPAPQGIHLIAAPGAEQEAAAFAAEYPAAVRSLAFIMPSLAADDELLAHPYLHKLWFSALIWFWQTLEFVYPVPISDPLSVWLGNRSEQVLYDALDSPLPLETYAQLAQVHYLAFFLSPDAASQFASALQGKDGGIKVFAASPEQKLLEWHAAAPLPPQSAAPIQLTAGVAYPKIHWANGLFLILLLLALSTWITEDITCILAGILVGQGVLPAVPATLACIVGIYSGDMLLYLAGFFWGEAVFSLPILRGMVPPERLAQIRKVFEAKGPAIIAISRVSPGMRLPTYLLAGAVRTDFIRFNLYFILAAVIWTPILVIVAAFFGERMLDYQDSFTLIPALLLGVLVLYYGTKLTLALCNFRKRRLLVMRYKRMRHYEFWPTFVFYAPVILYILWLGLWHRCLTLFTLANPAIPASGIQGESKHEILDGIGPSEHVARYRFLPLEPGVEAQYEQALEFMQSIGATFPVILKPDVGERGKDIGKAECEKDISAYLNLYQQDTIIQEYIAGLEFGITYVRLPNEEKGRVFSLARKALITLKGDGEKTIEELILSDPRAVCLAKTHLKKFEDRLDEVLADGEDLKVVEIGTHSRGSIFLDANEYLTPDLEDSVDRLSKQYSGFYLGRYDVRTRSLEEFQAGTHYKVMELNPLTGEPAHMYDPKNSIFTAYAIVMRFWTLAFRIGRQNRQRGMEPLTVKQFFAAIKTSD